VEACADKAPFGDDALPHGIVVEASLSRRLKDQIAEIVKDRSSALKLDPLQPRRAMADIGSRKWL
jgi:hypothetical protein